MKLEPHTVKVLSTVWSEKGERENEEGIFFFSRYTYTHDLLGGCRYSVR